MLRRRKRQVLLLFGAGSILFTFQSVFQTLTLMPNEFEVEFSDTNQPRSEDGFSGLDFQSRNDQRNETDLHSRHDNNTPATEQGFVQPTAVFKRDKKKLRQTDSRSKSKKSKGNSPVRITKFENRTRAKEFNIDARHLYPLNRSRLQVDNPCVLKAMEPKFVYRNSTKLEVPFWQRKLMYCRKLGYTSKTGQPGYFLAELLQARIYKRDLAKWSIGELKQWIHFMLLAGVDHIFLCDHYKNESERLDIPLEKYINLGLVSYFNWSHIETALEAQVKCYEHIIGRNAYRTMWTIAVDMDEYPVSLIDTREGFLVRYMQYIMSTFGPRLSEISIPNFLMLGEGDETKDVVSSRINRITREEYGDFVKPIFRPKRVLVGIHRNDVLFGREIKAENHELRMLHYWGKRLQNWGPNTEEVLSMTEKTDFMSLHWEEDIRNSLLVFDEYDPFDSASGP